MGKNASAEPAHASNGCPVSRRPSVENRTGGPLARKWTPSIVTRLLDGRQRQRVEEIRTISAYLELPEPN
jgi:hypothetical protein